MKNMVLLLMLVVFAGCEDYSYNYFPDSNEKKVTLDEGVWGTVSFLEGDFMPSTDPDDKGGKITHPKRYVYFYKAVTSKELEEYKKKYNGHIGFYEKIPSEFIGRATTDASGFYQAPVPPGTYSVFILEDSLFYTARYGSEFVNPITVTAGKVSRLDIDIDYKAAY